MTVFYDFEGGGELQCGLKIMSTVNQQNITDVQQKREMLEKFITFVRELYCIFFGENIPNIFLIAIKIRKLRREREHIPLKRVKKMKNYALTDMASFPPRPLSTMSNSDFMVRFAPSFSMRDINVRFLLIRSAS